MMAFARRSFANVKPDFFPMREYFDLTDFI